MIIKQVYKGVIETSRTVHDFLKAVKSEDASRCFLSQAYLDIDKKQLSATDGRRIVIFTLDDEDLKDIKESGYYCPAKMGSYFYLVPYNVDGKYPNLEKVTPDYAKAMKDFYFPNSIQGMSQCVFSITKTIGGPIDISFLKILKGMNVVVKYASEKPSRRAIDIHFSNNHCEGRYIVMPMVEG